MKQTLALALVFGGIFFGSAAPARSEHSHAKHNMLLYGQEEIFASHFVYKDPHHYQVILKLTLTDAAKDSYLRERRLNPADRFTLLLDELDLKRIAVQPGLSGSIFRTDAANRKVLIASGVRLSRDQFEILFFNELPLSLAAGSSHELGSFLRETGEGCSCRKAPVVKCDAGETAYLCRCAGGPAYSECR